MKTVKNLSPVSKLIGKEKPHARNLGRNSVMCLHDEDEWKTHSWMKYLLLPAQIHNQADGFATSTWTQEWTR